MLLPSEFCLVCDAAFKVESELVLSVVELALLLENVGFLCGRVGELGARGGQLLILLPNAFLGLSGEVLARGIGLLLADEFCLVCDAAFEVESELALPLVELALFPKNVGFLRGGVRQLGARSLEFMVLQPNEFFRFSGEALARGVGLLLADELRLLGDASFELNFELVLH